MAYVSTASAVAPVYPLHYGIIGRLLPSSAGPAEVGSYEVIVYKTTTEAGFVSTLSDNNGMFIINGFDDTRLDLAPGTYNVAVVPKDNYGKNPAPFDLSPVGYHILENITLVSGEGPGSPDKIIIITGTMPNVTNLKFRNRSYQPALVARGEPFIVSPTTNISASIKSDYGIYTSSDQGEPIKIVINANGGPTSARTLTVQQAGITAAANTTAAGLVKELNFTQSISEDNALGEGANSIDISATNFWGTTTESVIVTVMSGPLKVIGEVLTFPSPYSPTKHGNVTIQYTLSGDGDIDILLVSGAKQVIKKIVCFKGTEGGSAGVNKVVWNGQMDQGATVGNGIYSGALISHAEGKILARFKLSVVD